MKSSLILLPLLTLAHLWGGRARAEDCGPAAAPVVADMSEALPAAEDDGALQNGLADFKILMEAPSIKDAPASFYGPLQIWSGGYQAWANSLPRGVAKEQGGLLVRNTDGSFEFKRGAAGGYAFWTPNYQNVLADEQLVAVLHTHPYSTHEGGHTGVPFSGNDMSLMINTAAPVEFVQSGDMMFVNIKSREFLARVAGLDSGGKARLKQQLESDHHLLVNRLLSQGHSFPEAMRMTVAEISRKYDLLYYEGATGSAFERVE